MKCWVGSCLKTNTVPVAFKEEPKKSVFDLCPDHLREYGEAFVKVTDE